MSKPRSERSRWTTVYTLGRPHETLKVEIAQTAHDELLAVAKAFAAVGRVIRVEPAKYGTGLVFKARRA